MKTKRLISAALAAVICVTSITVTGCGKKKGKGINRTVTADEQWYSVKQADLGANYTGDMQYLNAKFAGFWNDKPVYTVNGERVIPKDADPMKTDYSDYQIANIDIYGDDATVERSIDLTKKLKESDLITFSEEDIEKYRKTYSNTAKDINEAVPAVSWYANSGCTLRDGKVKFTAFAGYPDVNSVSFINKTFEVELDLESEKLTIVPEKKEKGDNSSNYIEKTYDFEGYKVEYGFSFSETSSSGILNVISPDGSEASYDIKKLVPSANLDYVNGIMYLGDGKVVFAGAQIGQEQQIFEMDLKSGTAKPSTKDLSVFLYDFYAANYVNGIGNIIIDSYGIQKIDLNEGKKNELLSFKNCDINRYEAQNAELLGMKGDKIYLASLFTMSPDYYNDGGESTSKLYILSKEAANPNAGKKVITAGYLGSLGYTHYETIQKFNAENPDYYVELDDSYSVDSKIHSGELAYGEADYYEKHSKFEAEMSNQLMVDLDSGDGPDIVLNGASYSNLYGKDLFMDLKTELGTEGLFENVIKASEKDGKIYHFPLAFAVQGILARKTDAGADQRGFTYDQYKDFVKGPCNGKDALTADQVEYFKICMGGLEREFEKNGKVNYDNEEFRMLSEFISANVMDPLEADLYMFQPVQSNEFTPKYVAFLTFSYLIYMYSDNISNLKILGLPSKDGRGPDMSIWSSIAISAQTSEKDGCIALAKFFLSDSVQESFSVSGGEIPVNKESFRKASNAAVDKYNAVYEKNKAMYKPNELIENGMPWHSIDKAAVDDFEQMINSCERLSSSDPAISRIMDEEMPAYFTGQKTLDEVIKIMQDRVQTVLNERK